MNEDNDETYNKAYCTRWFNIHFNISLVYARLNFFYLILFLLQMSIKKLPRPLCAKHNDGGYKKTNNIFYI